MTALSDADVAEWRRERGIDIDDPRAPKPVRTFMEAAFPEFITLELETSGFERPTPIQMQSWPIALSGRDMIGLASTGSGKTLCFALPLLARLTGVPREVVVQPDPRKVVITRVRDWRRQRKCVGTHTFCTKT